jgi:hypothetical protein
MIYYYYIDGNNKRSNNNKNTSFLAPGDTGKLGTHISVISVQTVHRNNLATWWSNEYPLDLIQSLYAAKLRHETVLLLWFVASP